MKGEARKHANGSVFGFVLDPSLAFTFCCGIFLGPWAVPTAVAATVAAPPVVLLSEYHIAFRCEVKVAGLKRLRLER
jgi:hypothetical protein